MFAFENWQSLLELKLYFHRFLHAIDGLNDLSSLAFPKYNRYSTHYRSAFKKTFTGTRRKNSVWNRGEDLGYRNKC